MLEGDLLQSSMMLVILTIAIIAAVFAARQVVTKLSDGCALAALTVVMGVPLWVTCDSHLVRILPSVDWFDPREPFAPYFLLYLPTSIIIAVTFAAALMMVPRLFALRTKA